MSTEYSSNYGYDVARNLRGTRLELAGATKANEDWLLGKGGSQAKRGGTWSLPMPRNNRDAAQLLYEITQRGMQWRAR